MFSRHKVQQEGLGVLRGRVVFLFQKGKRSRLEATPEAIAAALTEVRWVDSVVGHFHLNHFAMDERDPAAFCCYV
jgi:hypothetical protein